MSVSCRSSDEQRGGGLEITIALTPVEAEAVGSDAVLMAELLDSCLWAMGMLRTGANSRDPGALAPIPGDWATALRGSERLPPRIRGAMDGALRAYTAAGGSVERLADVNRRTEILDHSPSGWEQWATTGRI